MIMEFFQLKAKKKKILIISDSKKKKKTQAKAARKEFYTNKRFVACIKSEFTKKICFIRIPPLVCQMLIISFSCLTNIEISKLTKNVMLFSFFFCNCVKCNQTAQFSVLFATEVQSLK